MTFDPDNRRHWHDFIHTAATHLGSALARHDLAQDQKDGAGRQDNAGKAGPSVSGAVARSFAFELLAAQGEVTVEFTGGEMMTRSGGMKAVVEEDGGRLRIELQLVGYAMLKMGAGSEGRIVSRNGAIDERVQFSLEGSASLELDDRPETREGLKDYQVMVFE